MTAPLIQPWPPGTKVIKASASAGSMTKLFQAVARMMAQHRWRAVSIPEAVDNNGATEWRVRLERADTLDELARLGQEYDAS